MNILFVCTGNTCRSPMAEVICKDILGKLGIEASVSSGGVSVFYQSKASDNAIRVANKYKLDLSKHVSKQITQEMYDNADIILTMSNNHKNFFQRKENFEKVFTLCEFAGRGSQDITDPFGQDINEYESCFLQIKECIDEAAKKFKGGIADDCTWK